MELGRKRWLWLVMLAGLGGTGWLPAAHAKDLAVISNKSNGLQAIALADLVKVCKGETHNWPDGRPVTFIMLDPQTPEMKLVVQKVYESKAEDVKELIDTANHGRMNHPAIVVVKSDEEVVSRVQSIPGAVGVVDVYSITGGVAVIKVAGKNPFEPGYLLHGN
jgi:ABC-type phosphate transport system substrate-binding protein